MLNKIKEWAQRLNKIKVLFYLLTIILTFLASRIFPIHFNQSQKIGVVKFLGQFATTFVSIIFTAWIAYRFGLEKYIAQRRIEQLTARYVENGINLAIEGIESALAVYRRNWANSLQMLKNFRQKQTLGINMDPSEYSSTFFMKYDQRFLNVSPFQRILTLLGSDEKVYYDIAQLLFAKIDIASSFFEIDLCVGIKFFLSGDLKVSAEGFFNNYIEKIDKEDKDIGQYYVLIDELQMLSRILESKIIVDGNIGGFKDLKEVRNSLLKMNKFYKIVKENK
ncbi:MAG: hypothetical protein P9X22_07270 [Candidatus Zapsychrus exili]|nr:hypothetical protein [Candidatus Zapsychrus exili]